MDVDWVFVATVDFDRVSGANRKWEPEEGRAGFFGSRVSLEDEDERLLQWLRGTLVRAFGMTMARVR